MLPVVNQLFSMKIPHIQLYLELKEDATILWLNIFISQLQTPVVNFDVFLRNICTLRMCT